MNRTLIAAVASTVKALRLSRGFSQEELAHRAKLDRTYISGVERRVRNITLDSLESIVRALEVTVPDFLNEVAEAFRAPERDGQE